MPVLQRSRFTFGKPTFDPQKGVALLPYRLDDNESFTETISFGAPTTLDQLTRWKDAAGKPGFQQALRYLQIAAGTSYWKLCCPKEMVLEGAELTQEQAAVLTELYEQGMGEFFYKNKLNPAGLVNFPAGKSDFVVSSSSPLGMTVGPLVPIGGGKDSVVTTELLKAAGMSPTLFRVNEHPLIAACAIVADCPLRTVERRLDPLLFSLNASGGVLNGHVPATAIITGIAILTALLEGHSAVVLSAERSADEGNVEGVNHQWSKSLRWEELLHAYVKTFIHPELKVFSLLRPWSELMIAQEFCNHPEYFPVTTSCNGNWKIAAEANQPKWCGKCPKCAFSFLMFSAFADPIEVMDMFGANLLDREELLPLYRELLGVEGNKPFECVGTPEETKAAFLLILRKGDFANTAAMKMFASEVLPKITNADALTTTCMKASGEHIVPNEFLPALQ